MHIRTIARFVFALLLVGSTPGCPVYTDQMGSDDDDAADDDVSDDDDTSAGDDDSTGDDDTTTGEDDDTTGDDDDTAPPAARIAGTAYWYHCEDPATVILAPEAQVTATSASDSYGPVPTDPVTASYELIVSPGTYLVYGYYLGYEDQYADLIVSDGDDLEQDLYFVECDQDTDPGK